jgi:hypothetical protein
MCPKLTQATALTPNDLRNRQHPKQHTYTMDINVRFLTPISHFLTSLGILKYKKEIISTKPGGL